MHGTSRGTRKNAINIVPGGGGVHQGCISQPDYKLRHLQANFCVNWLIIMEVKE